MNQKLIELRSRPIWKAGIWILMTGSIVGAPGTSLAEVGVSDNGVLVKEWDLDISVVYGWGTFGVTPAIDEVGPTVNGLGGEPDSDIEIVTGSDGIGNHVNPISSAAGMWRIIDSTGAVERYTNTQCDEARGNIAVADLDGDDVNEYVGSTTSGVCIQVMDMDLEFIWTYQVNGRPLPTAGSFEFPAAPAVGDAAPTLAGLEVANIRRTNCEVRLWEGIAGADVDGDTYPNGVLIWSTILPGSDCHSTTTIADVDGDGDLEVIAGVTGSGGVYVLEGATGEIETSYEVGPVQASVSVADLDGDGYLEMAVGDLGGNFHVLQWDGISAATECSVALGSAIHSSVAIGDIDADGALEMVVGNNGGQVNALGADCTVEWIFDTETGNPIYASPALADRAGHGTYGIEWPMFQHDHYRTGYYGAASRPLDVYVGSMNDHMYLLDGNTGAMIDKFEVSGNIHGSVAVGDIDGDYCLETVFQSWGQWGGTAPKDEYDAIWNIEDTLSCVIPVEIDIKPGSDPNCFNNNGNGVIPVAILGSISFDVTQIDPETVKLEGLVIKAVGKSNKLLASVEDVNGDGYDDLVVKIEDIDGTFSSGDGTAILTGNLYPEYDGTAIEGTDAICVVP